MARQEIVEVVGYDKLSRDLTEMGERMVNARTVMAREVPALELAESQLFASYGGKYVESGALKASLAGRSGDSVRIVTDSGLDFGTSLYYARFQTEHIGPPTTRGGMARTGKNMVLAITDAMREKALRDLGEHIMGAGR